MRDAEQEYPKHQPGRGEHEHHDPFAIQDEGELEERPKKGPVHQREAATTPELPPGHARKSLIIGVVLGVLAAAQSIIITLKNTDLYNEAAKQGKNVTLGVATSVFGVAALEIAISVLIYFIGGLIIGKVAVHRRWAFIGGFVGGVISSLIGAVLKQIPAYPNAGTGGFSGSALGISGGIAALAISTILLGVLYGLVSLLGAWLMTRRHPYYVGYAG